MLEIVSPLCHGLESDPEGDGDNLGENIAENSAFGHGGTKNVESKEEVDGVGCKKAVAKKVEEESVVRGCFFGASSSLGATKEGGECQSENRTAREQGEGRLPW